ncbi:hypothetical protein F5Y07DRAFT_382146 [Xylaria sp. FL0933]|nr:hypothetical protein F5Y07DRAFT_382146 [Xylaria sp. FL0933]
MAFSKINRRYFSTYIILAAYEFLVFGASDSSGMLGGHGSEQPERGCGRDCVTGIIAGVVALICIGIVFMCVWSSRKSRTQAPNDIHQ